MLYWDTYYSQLLEQGDIHFQTFTRRRNGCTATTIVEKKDTFDLIVLQGRKAMPYATDCISKKLRNYPCTSVRTSYVGSFGSFAILKY